MLPVSNSAPTTISPSLAFFSVGQHFSMTSFTRAAPSQQLKWLMNHTGILSWHSLSGSLSLRKVSLPCLQGFLFLVGAGRPCPSSCHGRGLRALCLHPPGTQTLPTDASGCFGSLAHSPTLYPSILHCLVYCIQWSGFGLAPG